MRHSHHQVKISFLLHVCWDMLFSVSSLRRNPEQQNDSATITLNYILQHYFRLNMRIASRKGNVICLEVSILEGLTMHIFRSALCHEAILLTTHTRLLNNKNDIIYYQYAVQEVQAMCSIFWLVAATALIVTIIKKLVLLEGSTLIMQS